MDLNNISLKNSVGPANDLLHMLSRFQNFHHYFSLGNVVPSLCALSWSCREVFPPQTLSDYGTACRKEKLLAS